MKLKDLKQQMEERTKEVFIQDRKDWVEELQVFAYEDDEENCEFYDRTTDIFICKDGDNIWTPTIYWVKVKKQVFNSLLEGLKDDDGLFFVLNRGNDGGYESIRLEIRAVTDYYVYLSPEGWEDEEDDEDE